MWRKSRNPQSAQDVKTYGKWSARRICFCMICIISGFLRARAMAWICFNYVLVYY